MRLHAKARARACTHTDAHTEAHARASGATQAQTHGAHAHTLLGTTVHKSGESGRCGKHKHTRTHEEWAALVSLSAAGLLLRALLPHVDSYGRACAEEQTRQNAYIHVYTPTD